MEFNKSEKNTIKRGARKASYNKKEIYSILDQAKICNIAFEADGFPQVQPVNFGRRDNKIYIHGSLKNRMTNALIQKGKACLNVFFLDSMKLSKSAVHHSVNFRSVVIFGTVKELFTQKDKLIGLEAIINHFVPDRWENCRKPYENELEATRVLEIEIETASAKIAADPVFDNKEDEALDFWAGEIPIKTICSLPESKYALNKEPKIPKHIQNFYEKNKLGF